MNNPVIANMLFRAEHCRRLAGSITDERTRHALLTMADEIEADAKHLLQERPDFGGKDLTLP
jgi:hypothetical protein